MTDAELIDMLRNNVGVSEAACRAAKAAADRIEQLVAEKNAATAAAYEVAALAINDRGAVEQENFGLDRATQNFFRARDIVRALATPDQTAALDRLITEAEARVWKRAIQVVDALPEAQSPDVNVGVANAYAAILADSKKGGV